jgi:hypothetical protein
MFHYLVTLCFTLLPAPQIKQSRTASACNETNLMHYSSLVYSVTIPLHVSGLLVAHHQKVTMYICNNWYVLYVSQLKRTTRTICCTYKLLPPDDGQPASPKHVEVW